MQEFREWLQEQMDMPGRQWSKSDLHRLSGVDTGTISNILNGEREAGPKVLRGLAKALGLPEVVVFYRAGLITQNPEDPTQNLDALELEMLRLVEDKTDAEKAAAHAMLKAFFEGIDRGKSGFVEGNSQASAGKDHA